MPRLRDAIAALLAVCPAALLAQAGRDPHAVQPERPTVATHAYTVAPGYFELESGVEADRFRDHSHAFGVPTNLKLGLTGHAQLNVLAPLVRRDGAPLGVGDVAVGVKWRLLDRHPVLGDFALQPFVKLATGSVASGRGTGTTDLTLLAISSRTVGRVAVDLNASYTRRSGNGAAAPRSVTFWTASFGIPLAGKIACVLEYFGYPATSGPAGTRAYTAVLAGPTVLVRPWLGFDAGVIVPLAGGQSYALYAGGTWNAGRLWRPPGNTPPGIR